MPEELQPDSLSTGERTNPKIENAWQQGEALLHKEVVDSEGHRVGRVTKCFVEDGMLIKAQVTLDKNTANVFQIPSTTASFDPGVVAEAAGEQVRLRVPVQQIASTPGETPVGTNVEGHENAPQHSERNAR
ncbi:MAG TPA: hypothetical protein VNZ52_01855 [Candidatus Thermoplasmatota archaeon]|nr:hypothetical protein [Candidatus Thermoplasmatota archaeon]